MSNHLATILGRLVFAALALVAAKYLELETFIVWCLAVLWVANRMALKPIEQSFQHLNYLKEKLKKENDK